MKSVQTFTGMLKSMAKLWELGLTYPYEGWFSDKWDSYEHKKSNGCAGPENVKDLKACSGIFKD